MYFNSNIIQEMQLGGYVISYLYNYFHIYAAFTLEESVYVMNDVKNTWINLLKI